MPLYFPVIRRYKSTKLPSACDNDEASDLLVLRINEIPVYKGNERNIRLVNVSTAGILLSFERRVSIQRSLQSGNERPEDEEGDRGESRGEKKASKRANSDPLERRFTVKGFTNRRQVFATSADRKLFSVQLPPLFVQRFDSTPLVLLLARGPPSHRLSLYCQEDSLSSYTRTDRRSHIDEIYVRGRPILRMRSH